MKFKADFVLSAWIRDFEIEADSLEEAKDKLSRMSFAEINSQLEYGDEGYADESNIDDIDLDCIEKKAEVKVYGIEYVDDDGEEHSPDVSPVPWVDIEIYDGDDVDDLIREQISYALGIDEDNIKDFKYDIIREY